MSLAVILSWLVQYKYLILLPAATVEGPIISVMAGFLIAQGFLNLYATFTILILGDLIGDIVFYSIGRWGGPPFIRRWGHIFGLDENKLYSTESSFKKHPRKILLFGKTQPLGSVILTAAGATKMPLGLFMWINFLGTLVKSAVLIVVGYYFGQAYETINKYFEYGGIFMIIVAVPLLYYFIRRNIK